MRTAAILEHQVGEVLKPHGLTVTQFNVLRVLRAEGPAGLCGRDIATRLISRVPDVPRLLDRLAGMGLIERERSAVDRRHVTARITPEGRALLARVTPDVEEVELARLARLDPESLRTIIEGLAIVRDPT